MKRILATGFIIFLLMSVSVSIDSAQLNHARAAKNQKINELVFLTWSEYIDPDLIKEFEGKYQVKVKEVHFESDELRDQMILSSGVKGYDVVLASGPSLIIYRKKGWLTPVSERQVPNIKYIDKKYMDAYPDIRDHAVPYTWGTVGIAYRKDLVTKPVKGWMDLFKPSENMRGKIVMIGDSRDTIDFALKALGFSLNSVDPSHYDAAEKLLLHQKPYVAQYSYIALTEKSALLTGKAYMAMVYNGDALVLNEKEPNVAYTLPREGSALWIDFLVVMESSKKKGLAYRFINFINEPKNAARLSSYIMYATPNLAAEKYLKKDHLENRMIYPDSGVLDKCEIQRILPVRIIKKKNAIFSRLLS